MTDFETPISDNLKDKIIPQDKINVNSNTVDKTFEAGKDSVENSQQTAKRRIEELLAQENTTIPSKEYVEALKEIPLKDI